MKRKIISIDEEKCNGCGLCAEACHEGAIGMVNGKAKLLRDDYCDGLGACLPVCPVGALGFEEREAAAFDEAAVAANMAAGPGKEGTAAAPAAGAGCPGMAARSFAVAGEAKAGRPGIAEPEAASAPGPSQLCQWPVQIKLVPVQAPYFNGARLLVAADCTAFAHGAFHRDFMAGRVTLIGCPKLDEGDYSQKLAEILRQNDVKSVTVVRMEVPCCGGLEHAVKTALQASGKTIPWQVVTLSLQGAVLDKGV